MNNTLNNENQFNKKAKLKHIFIIQFICSIIILLIFLGVYLFKINNIRKKEKLSKQLLNSFNISNLYNTNITYEINKLSSSKFPFSVIGIIQIDKLKISYPILSDINDDFLEISPCKFYGAMPNEPGNLCIAGHNYDNGTFFSNINKLEKNDVIYIYDSNGIKKDYNVYDKFEVSSSNTNCTNQETNGICEITLVSCNNITNNRIIIKARNIK